MAYHFPTDRICDGVVRQPLCQNAYDATLSPYFYIEDGDPSTEYVRTFNVAETKALPMHVSNQAVGGTVSSVPEHELYALLVMAAMPLSLIFIIKRLGISR